MSERPVEQVVAPSVRGGGVRSERVDDPAAIPAAAPVAVVTSVALIVAGLIALRDFLVERRVIGGAEWSRGVFEWIAELSWQTWMLPAAAGAVVAGAAMLVLFVVPRSRPHVPAGGAPVLWLWPTDVARMCTATSLQVSGVVTAHTTASEKLVRVQVTTSSADPEAVRAAVLGAVSAVLAELVRTPRVSVVVAAHRSGS